MSPADLDFALSALDDLDDIENEIGRIVDAPPPVVDKVNLFAALQSWFPNNPLLWNAGKHLVGGANGDAGELEKAIWYLQQELKRCKPSS